MPDIFRFDSLKKRDGTGNVLLSGNVYDWKANSKKFISSFLSASFLWPSTIFHSTAPFWSHIVSVFSLCVWNSEWFFFVGFSAYWSRHRRKEYLKSHEFAFCKHSYVGTSWVRRKIEFFLFFCCCFVVVVVVLWTNYDGFCKPAVPGICGWSVYCNSIRRFWKL